MVVAIQTETGNVLSLGDKAKGNTRTVFQNPRGNKYWYAFYRDSSSNLILEYSTNGSSWSNSPQTVFNYSNGTVVNFDMKIYDTGSDLKIFVVLTTSDNEDLIYMRGSLSDSGTTPTWDTYQTIDSALVSEIDSNFPCAIARTDNGRLVVVFAEDIKDKGKAYRQTKIIGSDGDGASPSWSGETTIDDPTANTNNQDKGEIYAGIESFSSSYPNRVFIYARVPQETSTSTYQWATFTYDWNGSAMSLNDSDTSSGGTSYYNYISAIIDESDYAHLIYNNATTTQSCKSSSAGSADMTSFYQISSVAIVAHTLTLDRINDELYVFYRKTTDTTTHHYRKRSITGTNWESEQDVSCYNMSSDISYTSWNSDVESYLHLAFLGYYDSGTNDHYTYDTLEVTGETTAYKDVTLKTSLESNITYKDVTLKTSLHSLDYKDVSLKTSLESALTYKDISLKTTLESNLTYKDITLKSSLHSLDYKDIILKTSLHSLDYKDVTLKTTLESNLTYKDIAIKTSFTAAPTYKDVSLKTSFESALTYKDITLKTSLDLLDYKDITLKTTLNFLGYKDIALKTSLEAEATTDYKDITLKTSIDSAPTYKDISLKTTLESNLTYKDISIKTSLESESTYKDIALKTSLESNLIYKDISLKTTLESIPIYKDIVLKTTFDTLDYKDITLKTTLESSPLYKDVSLKTTFDLLDYKDISLKTTLDLLEYKDIALKVSFGGIISIYKDISIKVSLEIIPKEIIDIISSITQTEEILSSIIQTENIISSITQTENFISKINS